MTTPPQISRALRTHRPPGRAVLFPAAVLAAALLLVLAPAAADAQPPGEGWTWTSTDQSDPGTPAVVRPLQGGGDFASFQVRIHGFWQRPREGNGQYPFTEILVPGLGHTRRPGAPKLPLVDLMLAVPSDAREIQLAEVEVLGQREYEMVVYPATIAERDHPEGDPEQFLLDEGIYAGDQPFPAEPWLSGPVGRGGPIPGGRGQFMPATWSPRMDLMTLATDFVVTFQFPGSPGGIEPPTLERTILAEALFDNWAFVEEFFPPDLTWFKAEYLFVYPGELREALLPLIEQKKARGYLVTEIQLEDIVASCTGIRDAIGDWLAETPFQHDHYCLLVGDTDQIPLCTSPDLPLDPGTNTSPTDDLYASPLGDDLDEEVYLGRLSIDDFTDLETQVAKILEYEDSPALFVDYNRCGLVAHKENAPGKYVGAHESVRTASYSGSPVFTTLYGSDGVTDGDVRNFIESEVGLVAYRGHGSDLAWTSWNTSFQDFSWSDVTALGGLAATPVLWSFACNNNELDVDDCIGEVWLEHAESGAVAHYGATIPSYTTQNHELDRAMFRAVWDEGLVTHAMAIDYAESRMATLEGSDNAWMYLLLGDPEMKIRRYSPPQWTLVYPEQVPVCPAGGCQLEIQVYGEQGLPLENVIVSAWKPPAQGEKSDDVLVNRYTDAGGQASLPVAPTSEGVLRIVARDVEGNSFVQEIPVVDSGTAVPGAGLAPLRLSAAPSVTDAGTTFRFTRAPAQRVHVEVFDTRGRRVRELTAGPAATTLAWDGRDDEGRSLPTGVYYARVTADGSVSTTRVTMIR